jgi:hypothetical protein
MSTRHPDRHDFQTLTVMSAYDMRACTRKLCCRPVNLHGQQVVLNFFDWQAKGLYCSLCLPCVVTRADSQVGTIHT